MTTVIHFHAVYICFHTNLFDLFDRFVWSYIKNAKSKLHNITNCKLYVYIFPAKLQKYQKHSINQIQF